MIKRTRFCYIKKGLEKYNKNMGLANIIQRPKAYIYNEDLVQCIYVAS